MKITVYLNNKFNMQYDWSVVPRIGDKIIILGAQDVKLIAKVKDVIWGSLNENWLGYQDCEVHVYCK
jgi:hypothetical protein